MIKININIIKFLLIGGLINLLFPFIVNAQEIEWQKVFSGEDIIGDFDNGHSVRQTIDGDYIIVGSIYSNGPRGIIIKTDSGGNIIWQEVIKDFSDIFNVREISDGGFIAIGEKTTPERNFLPSIYLIRLNSLGVKIWEKTFKEYKSSNGLDIAESKDGGFVLTGKLYASPIENQIFLIKIDSLGNKLWERFFIHGLATSIQQTIDGGYILTGVTNNSDIYILKTDSFGYKLWEKIFGGLYIDYGSSVQETKDENYIVAGGIDLFGNDPDVYLIKLDSNGNKLWENRFGFDSPSGYDYGNFIQETKDNGYIISGTTLIFDNIRQIYNQDAYLIKTDSFGNKVWEKNFGGSGAEIASSIQQTTDKGYIFVGKTTSFATVGKEDIWLVKIKPFEILNQFWSQVQNFSTGGLNFRKTPGIQNKPADDIIKTLPNGWAVKVASTTDESDNFIDLDGYRWYKVEDLTDGVIGWMAAKNLTDGAVYLDYDFNSQSILEQKAAVQLDTSDKRKPVILQAVDNYYIASTTNSLYSPAGGFDGNNNFQKFIQGANFLKEFVLAITAQESGPSFNNEICSGALDGGIGIMQITSLGFKGLGSGLRNNSKLNDCNKNTDGWTGNLSKYYSNAFQGIYANIKDGFRVLQEKYRTQCYEEVSGGLYFTCDDIRRILTIWGYNGFGDKTGTYLNKIAAKLETLSNYFSGVVYSNTDQFIQKLRKADRQKILALLKSPGELQIEDRNGNITGVVNSVIQENIPNSLYEKDYKGVAVFFPKNPYIYRVIGIASGTYSLNVDFFNDDIAQSFKANDVSITSGEIHEYYIDWDALLNGEAGATLQIDQNGDKIIDKTFISDETLESEDIFLQSQTVIDFKPDTLNLESNGIATVYIELPLGYSVNNISTSSIRLNKIVHALSKPIEIGDYDKDGIPDLMVKFEREKIKSIVAIGEKVPITIIGKVFYNNGNYYHFKSQDIIKIINNKAADASNSTVSRWALVQRIFNDLGEKVIAVFYGIAQ